MAEQILSPINIWGDFKLPDTVSYYLIDEKIKDGVYIQRFYLDGKSTDKGKEKILFTMISAQQRVFSAPAIFMLKDFEDKSLTPSLVALARDGYIACTVDIEGKTDSGDLFTEYPEDLSFANYSVSKREILLGDCPVKRSCFYEWAIVIKYALQFIKQYETVSGIGVIGGGISATCLWQAVSNVDYVSSFVVINNTGWETYKGDFKFAENKTPQYSDEELSYIAGSEAQSYAQYIKCPTFLVSNSNDCMFEADRAHDTLKRVTNDFKGIYYENKCFSGILTDGVSAVKVFLEQTLVNYSQKRLRAEPLIESKFVNGECFIEVEVYGENIDRVILFSSEDEVDSRKRSYSSNYPVKILGNKYTFKFTPLKKTERAFLFATAIYADGFKISTNIEVVDFDIQSKKKQFINTILYSGKDRDFAGSFISEKSISVNETFCNKETFLEEQRGPQGINGLSIEGGIISFAVNKGAYNLTSGALIMFDVYANTETTITVSFISSTFNEKKEYVFLIELTKSKAWQNQKIDLTKFKTADGLSIKEPEKVEAIRFYSDSEVLINNVLLL